VSLVAVANALRVAHLQQDDGVHLLVVAHHQQNPKAEMPTNPRLAEVGWEI
jgi:hypothetical protein